MADKRRHWTTYGTRNRRARYRRFRKASDEIYGPLRSWRGGKFDRGSRSWADKRLDCLKRYCRKAGIAEPNIAAAEWADLYKRANGRCCICGNAELPSKSLCLDHCHITGRVRGALCQTCNKFLGYIKDDPSRLQTALNYISPRRDASGKATGE